MPGNVPPVKDERDGLLAFLRQQRYLLTLTAFGLTEEQARAVPTAGALSVGGLLKHVAATEANWIATLLQEPPEMSDESDYRNGFVLGPDETLAGVLERYEQVARRTEEVGRTVDLDLPVPVPPAPWNPTDVEFWSARWVFLHLIEETARHLGHADIVRESVDGATAVPLMAGAEGWPGTPWVTAWQPVGQAS